MAINRTTKLDSGDNYFDAKQHPPLDANDKVFARAGNDTVRGWDGNDTLHGQTGQDTLFGEKGNDTLYGGGEDDKLFGQQGNDKLYGGTGVDRLHGGPGSDKFYFATADTDSADGVVNKADTITDFSDSDQIYLEGKYFFAGDTDGPGEDEYSIWKNGSDWMVTWNSIYDEYYHDVIVKGADPHGDISFYV
jgi:Ca2+-binding RTX toxin-like protein